MLCTGGNTSGYIPTHTSQSPTPSGLLSGNVWRNFSSWMPQRENSQMPSAEEDSRFPGRGRTLGSPSDSNPNSSLQARLLENNNTDHPLQTVENASGELLSDGRQLTVDDTSVAVTRVQSNQGPVASDEKIQKLVAMGFERTQVEVALAASDGDLNVAVEILMSQQG